MAESYSGKTEARMHGRELLYNRQTQKVKVVNRDLPDSSFVNTVYKTVVNVSTIKARFLKTTFKPSYHFLKPQLKCMLLSCCELFSI